MKKEYLHKVALSAIVVLGSVRFWLAYKLPIMGDGGYHANLVDSVIESGVLSKEYNYPMLFHLYNSILGLFIGSNYIYFVPFVGVLTILLAYLLGKELFCNKVGLLFAFLVAIHPYHMLFTSVFFMDSTVAFFILITEYAFVKYIKTKNKKWLILTSVFSATCVSIKQFGYLMPGIIILQYLLSRFIYGNKTPSFKFSLTKIIGDILIILTVVLIISSGFLAYLYVTKGTIIDPGNPVFSGLKYNQEALAYQVSNYNYAHLNPRTTIQDIIHFYNPSTYFYKDNLSETLFFLLIASSIVYLLKKNVSGGKLMALIATTILIPYHYILTLVRTKKYFIHLDLISAFLLSIGLYFLIIAIIKNKKARLLISMGIVFLLITQLYIPGVADAYSRQNSMCWLPTHYSINNLIDAYKWIGTNSNDGDVIMAPCAPEGEYYSKRKLYWFNLSDPPTLFQALDNDDESAFYNIAKSKNIKYLVIMDILVEKERNTVSYLSPNQRDKLLSFPFIKEVFQKEGVSVYVLEDI